MEMRASFLTTIRNPIWLAFCETLANFQGARTRAAVCPFLFTASESSPAFESSDMTCVQATPLRSSRRAGRSKRCGRCDICRTTSGSGAGFGKWGHLEQCRRETPQPGSWSLGAAPRNASRSRQARSCSSVESRRRLSVNALT
jgi:hypothetical protein